MSFAQEFKNMRSAGGAPKREDTPAPAPVATPDATPAAPVEAAPAVDEQYQNPFQHGQTFGEAVVADDPAAEPVVPPAKEEPKKKVVKINGKTFNSEEEAFEYAASLEIELEKKDAFEKGKAAATPAPAAPPQIKITKKIADKLFEDPEGAIEDLQKLVIEAAEKIVDDRDAKKEAAIQQKKTTEQLWDGFYKNNADLADWTDEVNIVFQKELPNIGDLPTSVALDKLAELSRAYVKSVKERALPKQVLPSKTALTGGSGGNPATATKTQTTEKKISFADQVKSTNKRTAMQGGA